jgi:DUF4097 and DUF4098 domain-containing protein YvlB
METTEHRIPAEGLRTLTAHLDNGDIHLSRVEGSEVVVECAEGVMVERSEDNLVIRGGGRHSLEGARGKHRFVVDRHIDEEDMPPFGEPDKGDLGAFINTVVNQAVGGLLRGDLFQSSSHGRVRIGVPAVLEMPHIEISTSRGDLFLERVQGRIALHSHLGDIQVKDAGGSLEARSGKGDVEVRRFNGQVRAHTGAGDVELEQCDMGGSGHTGSGDIEGRGLGGSWELHTGSGDVTIDVHGSASFQIATGSGDIEVRGGIVERLEARTGSGDVECASVLHGMEHRLTTAAGDIQLSIANPPGARLQAITRMGSINSEFPLVMVGKQGPHSGAGSRYVGKVGEGPVEIELRTSCGDIDITRFRGEQPAGSFKSAARQTEPVAVQEVPHPYVPTAPSEPPMPRFSPIRPLSPVAPLTPVAPNAPANDRREDWSGGLSGKETDMAKDTPSPEAEPKQAAEPPSTEPTDNPRLKVLENLQRGEITVQEASALLRSLSVSA